MESGEITILVFFLSLAFYVVKDFTNWFWFYGHIVAVFFGFFYFFTNWRKSFDTKELRRGGRARPTLSINPYISTLYINFQNPFGGAGERGSRLDMSLPIYYDCCCWLRVSKIGFVSLLLYSDCCIMWQSAKTQHLSLLITSYCGVMWQSAKIAPCRS